MAIQRYCGLIRAAISVVRFDTVKVSIPLLLVEMVWLVVGWPVEVLYQVTANVLLVCCMGMLIVPQKFFEVLQRIESDTVTRELADRIHEKCRQLAGHWRATPYGGDMVLDWHLPG